jgi:hypothetical protein
MTSVPEIRRERVLIDLNMTSKEIQEKYGLPSDRAWVAKRKGFFVKNYSRKQVIIDPANFDPSISYFTAKRVFWKKFAWNNVAVSIKEDLIQEAVTGMYELSGKVKERSNGKYGIGYHYFWVAHNAMLSYLKTRRKGRRWRTFQEMQELQQTPEPESF